MVRALIIIDKFLGNIFDPQGSKLLSREDYEVKFIDFVYVEVPSVRKEDSKRYISDEIVIEYGLKNEDDTEKTELFQAKKGDLLIECDNNLEKSVLNCEKFEQIYLNSVVRTIKDYLFGNKYERKILKLTPEEHKQLKSKLEEKVEFVTVL